MNREIKFRAYCNIDKKMYPYALIGCNGELNVHADEVHVGRWKNIGCGREDGVVDYSFELLQFTGLKDVDGKEIYEGDIIKTDKGEIASVEKDNFQVTCFRMKGQIRVTDIIDVASCGFVSSDGNIKTIEVIGNVFENPELLK